MGLQVEDIRRRQTGEKRCRPSVVTARQDGRVWSAAASGIPRDAAFE